MGKTHNLNVTVNLLCPAAQRHVAAKVVGWTPESSQPGLLFVEDARFVYRDGQRTSFAHGGYLPGFFNETRAHRDDPELRKVAGAHCSRCGTGGEDLQWSWDRIRAAMDQAGADGRHSTDLPSAR